MSFWNTFKQVYYVRLSVSIQEALESFVIRRRRDLELKENLPKIIDELNKKNDSWNEKIEIHRQTQDNKPTP